MFNFTKILLLANIALISTSCLKQSESIAPIADVRTLAQLQRESMMTTALLAAGNNELSEATKSSLESSVVDPTIFYLNLKYKIVNMDINDNSNTPNGFEHIGNSLLKAFARIFLKISGSRRVHLGIMDLPIPNLNLDFSIVKSLKLKKVFIEYNKDFDAETGNIANFSFIRSLSLSKIDGENPLLISYQKGNNNCLQKCINFDIVNGDIFDLVKNSKTIPLKPALTIGSLPSVDEFKLDGEIDLQIGLKLPF